MSFTIVTALVNINRGNWDTIYNRKWQEYLTYMQNILRIDAPMCIYVESETINFVRKCREGYENTKIIPVSIVDYELYKDHERIRDIQSKEKYQSMCVEIDCPEVCEPLYCVVVNNKVQFLYKASANNPFSTRFFVWLDAGYGHNKFYIPPKHSWSPDKYLQLASEDRIVINTLSDKVSSEDCIQFFKDHQDFMDGGMVVGTKHAIELLYNIYYNLIEEIMEKDIVDDDQYFMTMTYTRDKNLFKLVRIDGWNSRAGVILT